LKVVGDIAETLITVFAKVLSAIKPLINFAIDGINLVIRGLNLIRPGQDIPFIKKIGESSGTGGFSGTMPDGTAFSTSGAVSQTPEEKAILAASVAASQRDAKVIIAGQAQGLTAAQALAAAAAASSSNVVSSNFNPAAFRIAEDKTSGTVINVTVNGAIDSEGTARSIVETLNSSYYRGTGGAGALVAV